MPVIRVLFLWHMHQPFYKDLVSGQYRLPWVRMHALKDYYGMVKLLDEFPNVHQTFNLVPSLIAQMQDYIAGTARDPFLELAAKPAAELSPDERRFALSYFFQANPIHMIGRYPRYRELWDLFRAAGSNVERALGTWHSQDFADLQVLSQLAWFDEFFLEQPEIAELVRKGRDFNAGDQRLVIAKQREIMAAVLPAYSAAAQRGSIEISATPFYHPILPLVCDSDQGGVSSPGLHLPPRFHQPDDAREQLRRALDLHERTFGVRPAGVWPSEGSVSEEVISIAHQLGVEWMATDEGVLGRSIGFLFERDGGGRLYGAGPQNLYRVYRYERGDTSMHMVFRDHTLSDLVGFVYSGMNAGEAAGDFIRRIKENAAPVLAQGVDATVAIILDGENAWEYYPGSGREFLRRLYAAIEGDPSLDACTVSEAIFDQSSSPNPTTRHVPRKRIPQERRHFGRLQSIVPGSWINANFNIWIGAPEDNRAWEYLGAARDFYAQHAAPASEAQRNLALEELLIAEGSDWNWWYGPEHHSENDRDFDELYRKHLSNVYHTLGATPPEYLAQPITVVHVRPTFVGQSAYIHPRIASEYPRYFDWLGAAMYTADRRAGAMHGKLFLLDSIYAGIDGNNVYGRLEFSEPLPDGEFDVVVNCEYVRSAHAGATPALAPQPMPPQSRPETATAMGREAKRSFRLLVKVRDHRISNCSLSECEGKAPVLPQSGNQSGAGSYAAESGLSQVPATAAGNGGERPCPPEIETCLRKDFLFRLPFSLLNAELGGILRLRFSLWRERLPVDALPLEGWMELPVLTEDELAADAYNYGVHT